MIPLQNIKGLVLKDEVIEAVKEGKFNIYAINNINEGIELLTGIPFETVHKKVMKKLKEYYRKAMPKND
jgi:predicted ATP-dependent protease